MKVVQINFTLRLELVNEIEETESKGGAGAMPGGWKPADTKKLGTPIAGPLLFTKAVGDPNHVDAGSIKDCEVGWFRGKGTLIVDGMAELIGCT